MPGYKTEIKEEEKERIIKEFLPYVKYSAYRLSWRLPPHLTVDDLISVGLMGLMGALDRFEEGRVKLKTYAKSRIKGAMLDELRSSDTVSRSTKKIVCTINKTHVRLERELGRVPDHDEVADALKMPLDDYYRVIHQASSANPISIEDLMDKRHSGSNLNILECLPDSKMKNGLNILEENDIKEKLAGIIDKLREKERQVLSLYYWEELTMKEIGRVLSITESRVCQIHSQALDKLRERFND